MSPVVLCAVIMGVLGIAFGIGLALASRFFRVDTDPRIEEIAEALPGINCGACGFAGCDAYAEGVAKGAEPDLCVPGGPSSAMAVAHIMGLKLETERQAVRATVHCQGGSDVCGQRCQYNGIEDCRAAHLVQAGSKMCDHGCLGYGTCAGACPFGAILMGPDRIPVVDWDTCTGCGTCVKACPRDLIETLPASIPLFIACSSQGRGKSVKQTCKVGCIACWICVKKSPEGAIEKNGNLPRLIYPEGVDYAEAMDKCPMHCFVKVEPPLVAKREPVASEASA